MAQRTLTKDAWQEREALRDELTMARRRMTSATICLRHAANPKERARDFMRERPVVAIVTTLVAGALVARLLPALIWRSKGSVFKRFTGQLIKGAAGAALPIITRQVSAKLKARKLPPNTLVLERPDPIVL